MNRIVRSSRCEWLVLLLILCCCGNEPADAPISDVSTPPSDSTGADAALPDYGCAEMSDCTPDFSCLDGVCVLDPTEEVRLTDNSTDTEVDNTGIQLGCVGGALEAPDGPTAATVYGRVDRFGSGRLTTGIEVAVFTSEDWNASPCVDKEVSEQNECFRTMVSPWTAVSTDPAEGNPTIPATCEKHLECPDGYECVEIANGLSYGCKPQHGLFEISSVPTNTWLVIRSRNIIPIYEKKWKDTYIHSVYLYADQVDGDGRIKTNAMMVSDGQWVTVPNTLLVKGGIKKNNGAVGGRIRDCRSTERSSFTVGNASIGLLVPGRATGYFNDDEENTVPLLDRTGTDKYGRFTAVDVAPGPNRVAASIRRPDGTLESLGSEEFFVVPNTLSIVSFPGKQPILSK